MTPSFLVKVKDMRDLWKVKAIYVPVSNSLIKKLKKNILILS